MNTTLQIILGEAFIILLVVVVGIVVHHWRRAKKRQSALEELLDQVSASETMRKEKLISYLVKNHQLDSNKSAELCEDFIEAEKRFMYEFIQQQLGQVPVTGCYENVCRLLDNYLQLLTTTSSETSEAEQEPEQIPAKEDELSKEKINDDSEPQSTAEKIDTESQEPAEQIEGEANTEDSEQEVQDEFAEDRRENQEAFDATTDLEVEETAEEEPDEFAEDSTERQEPTESITASETEQIAEKDEFAEDDEAELDKKPDE